MRVRVAGIWRHPKSKVWWFRMAVPDRYRAAVGKREWKVSLGETDEARARLKHAEKLAEVRRLMEQIDAQAAVSVADQAKSIVEQGLEALARANMRFHSEEGGEKFDLARGIDNVSYAMLKMLAFRTRLDWGGRHALAAKVEAFGPEDNEVVSANPFEPDDPPRLGAGFQSLQHRKEASAHIDLFEGQTRYQGAAYREIARGLLAARDWQAASFEAQIVADAAGVPLPAKGALFEAIAERILRHLADHRFQHWPASIDIVLNPMMTALSTHLTVNAPVDEEERTLTALLKLWRRSKGLGENEADKTADEWQLAVNRFRDMMGTEQVHAIRTIMVKRFRDKLLALPSRPKMAIRSLPLHKQIEKAEAEGLPTLSAPSVGKHIAAIKSLLAFAKEEEDWISSNPAEGVVVEGARYDGTERDHFTDAEMQLIYGSLLMTNPEACSNTMFWILFLAPFHGSRPGEHCQLRPADVIQDDGEWIMRFRAERRRRRSRAPAPDGSRSKRVKTLSSVRDVPLHWIVIEGGFLELVELQRRRGAHWVFNDLRPDKYGDRYKYLSRDINDALRELGISDTDKAFYSTRHSFKREGRRRRVPEHSLDQMAGHAAETIGRRYGQGVPVDILKQDVDKLEFRSVDWDPVVTCALERLRRAKAAS